MGDTLTQIGRYEISRQLVDTALASAAHTVSGSFAHHYQGHMPIGPSCG